MKAIFINTGTEDTCLNEAQPNAAFNRLLEGYATMESEIIYFSAGEGRIKEILIKKEPVYSL